jgi:hypothetical protein
MKAVERDGTYLGGDRKMQSEDESKKAVSKNLFTLTFLPLSRSELARVLQLFCFRSGIQIPGTQPEHRQSGSLPFAINLLTTY